MPEQAARSGAGSRATGSGTERGVGTPPRRTVVIRGQVADRYGVTARSSGSRRASRSYGRRMRPERAALWAVLLGFVLVVVALASAHF